METEEYRRTVGDYVTLVRGITYKGTLVGKPGPALLGLGSIEPGGGFREGHYKTYGGDCPASLMLFPGDLYVALKGATKDGKMIGSVARVPRTVSSGRLTQDTVKLEFRNPDPKEVAYLYWVLRTPQYRTYCANRATGSAVVALSRHDFLTYPVPPLTPMRKQLVDLFDALNDKIQLNQKMNRTLEAMARAIFKSWFVDFDPVRAKMEGRQPTGMDAATSELFPSEFEESALGMIPKGWTINAIGKEVEIVKGKSYKSSELASSSTALVTLKSVQRGGGYQSNGLKPYTGDYKSEQIIKPGELIVAYTDLTQAADVIGKPAIVQPDFKYETLVASLDISIVRPKNNRINLHFLYCLFLTDDFQSHVYGHTNGSTVLHLSKDGIPSYEFVCPPQLLLTKFKEIVEPLFCHMTMNNLENVTLTSLRDTLLPKLLSGEIRVKEAEKVLETVT